MKVMLKMCGEMPHFTQDRNCPTLEQHILFFSQILFPSILTRREQSMGETHRPVFDILLLIRRQNVIIGTQQYYRVQTVSVVAVQFVVCRITRTATVALHRVDVDEDKIHEWVSFTYVFL